MTTGIGRRTAFQRRGLSSVFGVAALAASLACGGGGDGGTPVDEVGAYLQTLPPWTAFSPPRPDADVQGTTGQPEDVDVDGRVFVCRKTPVTVDRTPRELVMYSPDVEILWPGALIQGRSYRDLEALAGLTIAERTPIKVSIPALKTADNFREVVPDQATVSQAIGAMVGAATADDLEAPSSTDFKMQSFASEQQFALSMGLSGRYMGFRASATGEYATSVAETTVVVHFVEKMFEVVVAPPQTPSAFFSSAFTKAKLDAQVALDRIGPDNLPLYVSNVVYGRMFTFAMSSTASEQEIRATLQAAYSWGTGKVQTELSARQKEVLSTSKIAIASVGGSFAATAAAIQSGDWRAYFSTAAPLSTATPLSYTFRSLADGMVALVTETTTYDRTLCGPKLAPGFVPRQDVALQMAAPSAVAAGDVDGDGLMDLVWNHRYANANEVRVGFGQTSGTFYVVAGAVAGSQATPAGGWTDFELLVADMDGDRKGDLVWNRVGAGRSETYVAISRGDGTFDLQPVHVRTDALLASDFAARVAHVQWKEGAWWPHDLLWNRIASGENTVLASVWGGEAPLDLAPGVTAGVPADLLPSPSFGVDELPRAMLADVTGDGVDDLVFGLNNRAVEAVNDGFGSFTAGSVLVAPSGCVWPNDLWRCPQTEGMRVADVDGDHYADLVGWDKHEIYRDHYRHGFTQAFLSNGQGGFKATAEQHWYTSTNEQDLGFPVDPDLCDVNRDGWADLVWIETGVGGPWRPTTVEIYYAYAQRHATRGFEFGAWVSPGDAAPSGIISMPAGEASWGVFEKIFGDVNGDMIADIVLTNLSQSPRIYVLIL